jgi:hypothetical protein
MSFTNDKTRISPNLAAALGLNEEASYCRMEITRALQSWLAGKGIRAAADGRLALDEEACAVLRVPANQEVSLLNLAEILRPHFRDYTPLSMVEID